MDAPLFRPEALATRRRPEHGERLRASAVGLTLAACVAMAVLVALVALATQTEVPRRATVRGYLTPDLGLTRVHPPYGAVILRVDVAEGDEVHAGQPLVALRDVTTQRDIVVRAPVFGRVAQLTARRGEQAHPLRSLATLIPAGAKLEAVLLMSPADIGLVRPGMTAVIRLDAFPSRRHGTLSARIREVPDSTSRPSDLDGPLSVGDARYRVTADLLPGVGHGPALAVLRPDLTLEADVVLERTPLWARVFEPISEAPRP